MSARCYGRSTVRDMKIALAGAGAFGIKHLDGLRLIDGVEVVSLVGRELGKTQAVADKYGIGHATTDLAESLAVDGLDAVILCTPTQMHAAQAIQCLLEEEDALLRRIEPGRGEDLEHRNVVAAETRIDALDESEAP